MMLQKLTVLFPACRVRTKSEKIRKKYGNKISYENRHLTRQLDYKKEQIIPIEGKAGDLIIFNTDVWHRAGIVKKGERKVMRGHTRPNPHLQ